MGEYKHRMSLVVPKAMMLEANQLALIVGESEEDINTFSIASWEDGEGNSYSVCSTAIKQVVLGLFGINLTDITLPSHASNADIVLAQQALNKVVMYKKGYKVDNMNIMCAIDFEPLSVFADMGLINMADNRVII